MALMRGDHARAEEILAAVQTQAGERQEEVYMRRALVAGPGRVPGTEPCWALGTRPRHLSSKDFCSCGCTLRLYNK